MKALKTLFIATALLGSAAGVQAADNFVGLTWGETSNNIQKSKSLNRNLNSPNLDKVIDNTGTWGIRPLLRDLREHLRHQQRQQAAPAEPARQLRRLPADRRQQHQAVRRCHPRPGQAGTGRQGLQARQRCRLRCRAAGRYPAGAEQECLDRRRLSLPAHQRQHRDDPAWRQQAGLPGPAQQLAILPGRQLQVLNDRAAPARACFDGRAGRSGRISSGGTS